MQNMSVDISQSTALWFGGFSGCGAGNDSDAMTVLGPLLRGKTHSRSCTLDFVLSQLPLQFVLVLWIHRVYPVLSVGFSMLR